MMYSNWKGHVRYINILTLLQGFRVKIVNVKSQVLLSLNSQKRLGYKPQKKTPNIDVCFESLGAMLEHWFLVFTRR